MTSRTILATLLAVATVATAHAARVASVAVLAPEGRTAESALPWLRASRGQELDEALVDRHVDLLGELGWVQSVDVEILPTTTPEADEYDLIYTLVPFHQVEEVRIEGSQLFDEGALGSRLVSRPGQSFDLRRALGDAHAINQMYQDAGYSFSGVLNSENVEFRDGVLTFKIRESHLAEADRVLLEKALGTRLDGAMTRRRLAQLLFDSGREAADLQVDRSTGAISLGPPREAPVETAAGAE